MEALVIAAGMGRRLNHRTSPKPLARLLGLSLIERTIHVAKQAGITGFKIVVGYQGTRIMQTLGTGAKYGNTIDYIHNRAWPKGNGTSVLAARCAIEPPFVLLMADHLCEESLLADLIKCQVREGECVLAIDRNLKSSHFSLDDVTRVHAENGLVTRIGKSVHRYNALDTGFFLCSSAIFDALERTVARGRYDLSSGNQILADMSALRTLDVTGKLWIDVDDEVAYRKARRILLDSLVKPTDGPVSKQLNRKISARISALLSSLKVTPNHLTVFSFVVAAISAFCFFQATPLWIMVGGVLAQISSILDGCDGEIARLKFQHSFFGAWLDRVLDRYADGLILLGMSYAVWHHSSNPMVWLVGGLALMGTFMNSYTAVAYDKLLARRAAKRKFTFRMGRDVRLFAIFVGAVFNQLWAILVGLMLITNFESIRRLFALRHVPPGRQITGKRVAKDYLPLGGAGGFSTR
ncbi:MAG: CDP-alcohol phosphatidyltransferase family protein [bacterium]